MYKILILFLSGFFFLNILAAPAYGSHVNAQECEANDAFYDVTNDTCISNSENVVVGPCNGNSRFGELCTWTDSDVPDAIRNSIIALLIIASILALFFLVWGGIKWITSGGDKTKVESARQTILAAIIGLILALLSFFILSFVLGIFGISFQNLSLPTLPK